MKTKYQSDLTDSQWNHIKDFFPPPKATGRPREVDFRQVVNAILFLLVSGCQWQMIPKEFPAWQTVYFYFAKWNSGGIWFRLHETLRAEERSRQGKTSIRRQVRQIRKVLKQRQFRRLGVLMPARKSMVAGRHLLVIHWV